jgi:DNA modification methylase
MKFDNEITMWDIERIIPYEKNPKKHPEIQIEKLARHIAEVGWDQAIVVDENGIILKGHGRHMAAKMLSLKQVPVIMKKGLTESQKKKIRIADNKLGESGWVPELLKLELQDIKIDTDIGSLGFENHEIEDIFGKETKPIRDIENEDDVEDEHSIFVKEGDVWFLGEHKIICSDCTDIVGISKLLKHKAEVCFTSPPYSDLRDYEGGLSLSPKHLAKFFDLPAKMYFVNLGIQIKDREVIQYWNDYIDAAKERNLKFLSWCVWNKGNASAPAHQQALFGISHEWIFVFGEYKPMNLTKENKGTQTWGQATVREKDGSLHEKTTGKSRTHRQLDTVFELQSEKNFSKDYYGHPAQFPVALPEAYILSATQEGDTVLEPFLGSGTTLIACEKTGRKCVGIEIAPKYCSMVIRRFINYTEQSDNVFRENEDGSLTPYSQVAKEN